MKNREDRKERVLSYLNTRAFRGDYWSSMADISRFFGWSHSVVKVIVFEMITEGLVTARDGDTDNQTVLVSVPKSIRTRAKAFRSKDVEE